MTKIARQPAAFPSAPRTGRLECHKSFCKPRESQVLGFLGPNGAGRTTTINMNRYTRQLAGRPDLLLGRWRGALGRQFRRKRQPGRLFDVFPASHGFLALQQVLNYRATLEQVGFRLLTAFLFSLLYLIAGVMVFQHLRMQTNR